MAAFSGLYDNEPAADGSGGDGHTLLVDRSPIQKRIARAFKRRSLRRYGDYLAQLTTSDSPSADVSYDRVQAVADPGENAVNGGVRTIETVTVQASSTNYSSDDVSDADEMGNMSNDFDPYPSDDAGNGGGGKGEDVAPKLG